MVFGMVNNCNNRVIDHLYLPFLNAFSIAFIITRLEFVAPLTVSTLVLCCSITLFIIASAAFPRGSCYLKFANYITYILFKFTIIQCGINILDFLSFDLQSNITDYDGIA